MQTRRIVKEMEHHLDLDLNLKKNGIFSSAYDSQQVRMVLCNSRPVCQRMFFINIFCNSGPVCKRRFFIYIFCNSGPGRNRRSPDVDREARQDPSRVPSYPNQTTIELCACTFDAILQPKQHIPAKPYPTKYRDTLHLMPHHISSNNHNNKNVQDQGTF